MKLEKGLKRLEELSAERPQASKDIAELFDDGSFTEIDRFTKNGAEECALVAAYGQVNGILAFAFMQSSGPDGAMGTALSKKIEKVYSMAKKVGAPVIGIYNSDGAHIEEGIDAMEAYASLISKIAEVSGVVPQISIVTGSCIGSCAVMASMADVVIMAEDAQMYVTAGTVLKSKDVGTAKLASDNGTAAIITKDEKAAYLKAAEIISYLPQNNLSLPYSCEYVPSSVTAEGLETYSVINSVVDGDSFCELYKDYAKDTVVGFARVNGNSIAVVATNTDGKSITAAGANKIARFVRFADAFSLPVISFLNADGIMGNKEDEISGGVKCAAQLTQAFSEATTAKITVITGAAVGAAYIAFASKASGADSVFAWPTAYISALKPETQVEFSMKEELAKGISHSDLENEYIDGDASVFSAAAKGFVEDVISPLETAPKIALALDCLGSKRVSTISKKHSNIQL